MTCTLFTHYSTASGSEQIQAKWRGTDVLFWRSTFHEDWTFANGYLSDDSLGVSMNVGFHLDATFDPKCNLEWSNGIVWEKECGTDFVLVDPHSCEDTLLGCYTDYKCFLPLIQSHGNSCQYANDGICDYLTTFPSCSYGSDAADCEDIRWDSRTENWYYADEGVDVASNAECEHCIAAGNLLLLSIGDRLQCFNPLMSPSLLGVYDYYYEDYNDYNNILSAVTSSNNHESQYEDY